MSDTPTDPTGALLAAAIDPKTTNQAYGIFQALKKEQHANQKRTTIADEIEAAKKAGFVVGAKVTRPLGGRKPGPDDVGEVVGYNTSEFGFYNGFENPVRVKFPNTTDVYPYKNYLELVHGEVQKE